MKKIFLSVTLLIASCSILFAYQFTISGTLSENRFGKPVPGYSIQFFVDGDESPLEAETGIDGRYTLTFDINEDSALPILININNKCNEEYTKTVYSFAGKSRVNFKICLADEDYICNADFDYEIDSKRVISLTSKDTTYISSYTWSAGDQTMLDGKSPQHQYSSDAQFEVCLTVKGSFGCYDTVCKEVSAVGTQRISGSIYLKNTLMPEGTVYMYKKERTKYAKPLEVKATDGHYSYDTVTSGNYIFYAIYEFEYDLFYFPKFIPTYTGSKIFWQDAIGKSVEEDVEDINLYMVSYDEPYYGKGSISGTLKYSSGAPVDSKGKIPILLLNEQYRPMDYTLADSQTGEFKFDYLPNGKYFIHPEKAGLKTQTQEVHLTDRLAVLTDINFDISNDTIFFALLASKPERVNKINLFPNPVISELNIQIDIEEGNDRAEAIIYNIQGKEVIRQQITEGVTQISLDNAPSGLFFVKIIDSNGKTISFKRIVKK